MWSEPSLAGGHTMGKQGGTLNRGSGLVKGRAKGEWSREDEGDGALE